MERGEAMSNGSKTLPVEATLEEFKAQSRKAARAWIDGGRKVTLWEDVKKELGIE